MVLRFTGWLSLLLFVASVGTLFFSPRLFPYFVQGFILFFAIFLIVYFLFYAGQKKSKK